MIKKDQANTSQIHPFLQGIYRQKVGSQNNPIDRSKNSKKTKSKGQMMKCALIYDFDGTLAKGNCAEYGLINSLGFKDKTTFWNDVKTKTKENDSDEIITYLGTLLKYAKDKNITLLSRENLKSFGKEIELFPGVNTWFPNINEWAADHDIDLEHYIISSGLHDMILGTEIAKFFKKIYACRYQYTGDQAEWLSLSVNYTEKTQYLFRISKGIDNCWDNSAINRFIPSKQRPLPFDKMIYLGDGDTDIPAMKMVKNQGGHSIAVFNGEEWKNQTTQLKIEKLIAENRASYVVPADYTQGSHLDITVRGILRMYSRAG